MQGDLQRVKYGSLIQTARTLHVGNDESEAKKMKRKEEEEEEEEEEESDEHYE